MQQKALQYLPILSLFISLNARGQLFECSISGVNLTPAVEATCAATFNGPFLTYQVNPTAPSTYQWEIYPHAPYPNTCGAYIVGPETGPTVQVNPGYNRGSFLLICRIRALDPPQEINSCILSVTVYKPEVIPIPANRCGPGSVTLGATGCIDNLTTISSTVKWYDAPVGGNMLHTGTTCTTPILSVSKSYWVSCTINVSPGAPIVPFDCETERIEVVAGILPVPVINCHADTSVCINAGAYILTGIDPAGGTYSGPGISGDQFDPAAAGPGNHTITYSYTNTETGCTNSCTFIITVIQSAITNDDAPGAIHLTVDAGCAGSSFSNTCATQSEDEPYAACKGTAGYKTSWFKFIAPPSGNVRVSTDNSGGTMGSDSRLALFGVQDVNNYATFSHIACDDDNGVTLPGRSILYATDLTPGITYYIQVDGKDASTAMGSFCLTVDELTSSMISKSTACTVGMPLNSVNDHYTGWHSLTDVAGKLIAMVNNTSGGATTSTYNIGLNINSGSVRQDPVSLQHYLDRNFQIINPAVSNVSVQFFFLNSELANLKVVDPGASHANLQVLRQTGEVCNNNFVAANGLNTLLAPAGIDNGTGFGSIQVTTTGLSKFFIYSPKFFLPVKVFLQGAYNTNLSRHKDVTTTWAAILNANALNQPYHAAPFNYPGTEAVLPGFFTSTTAATDIVDWVLIELRDAATPATVITRRAVFIREDGRIVDLDGISDVSFRSLVNSDYHLTVHHRNHLGIRTATVRALNGTMGIAAPAIYDFSTGQAKAFQNTVITSNTAMKDFPGGVFGLWGANVNGDGSVRATGLPAINDYLLLTNSIGGNATIVLNNVYSNADINMDGQLRATGLPVQNDYSFLVETVLGFDATKVLVQHQ